MQERRLGSRYILTEVLGGGASGRVYRARVDVDGAPPGAPAAPGAAAVDDVAVKVLRDDLGTDPELVHRFLQEGRLLKSVDHPNVVRIRDLVAEGDQLALVMDLVEGGDLRRAVPTPCPPVQAAHLVAGIADGLAAVHAAGITHRDLKPENVLVEPADDGTARPRISDFGVSRYSAATSTDARGMTGTVGYIAPEIARGGAATPAGDVYALGVILYELYSGHPPFDAENPLALVRAHAEEDPVPRPPSTHDRLWELTEALLAKDPDARPTAAEAARRLREVAPGLDAMHGSVPEGCFRAASTSASASASPEVPTPRTSAPPTIVARPSDPVTLLTPAPAGSGPGTPAEARPTAAATPPAGPVEAPPLPPAGYPAVPGPGRSARRPRTAVAALATMGAGLLVAGLTWAAWPGHDQRTRIVAVSADPETTTTSSSAPSTRASAARVPAATRTVTSVSTRVASIGAPPVRTVVATVTQTPIRPAAAPVAAASSPQHHAPSSTHAPSSAAAAPAPAQPAPAPAPVDPRQGTVPLYRYWNPTSSDHFYTSSYAELGAGASGYRLERIQGYVFPSARAGTVPLYRYWNPTSSDHFYTTNHAELGAGTGNYRLEGILGYVDASPTAGTVPLYRYWNPTSSDHFYTTDYAELGAGASGFRLEGIQAYVR